MKTRYSLLAVVLLLAAACALPGSGTQTLNMLNSWVRGNINDCILRRGQPTSQYRLSDGSTLYTWHEVHSREAVTSGNGSLLFPFKTTYVEKYCDTTLTANASGVIVHGRYNGNDCD